ncbi:MAG: hypothetical protein OXF57_13325, partial [Rhodospirillaceae bacterium]|nr:hypothetical protein [Rhodospirillaceae bacterium]
MIRPSGLAGCCILSLALSAAIVSPGTLEAQNSGLPTGSKAPITIEADQGVEWRRKEQIYVARGNAVARQKQTSIRADELIAHYRKSEGKKTQIWKVVATGNVNIETAKETATGETAVYTVDTGVFVLRGGDLMLKNKSQTITATGRIEYRDRDRRAYVIGNAKVVDGKRILRADRFIAHLEDARDDKVKVRRVEARGNVVITTEDERRLRHPDKGCGPDGRREADPRQQSVERRKGDRQPADRRKPNGRADKRSAGSRRRYENRNARAWPNRQGKRKGKRIGAAIRAVSPSARKRLEDDTFVARQRSGA